MTKRLATTVAIGLASIFLAAPAPGAVIYYTAESASGWAHLYSIDTDSARIADRGELHGQRYVTDLAFDYGGALYGVGWANGSANGTAKLYEIVPGDADTAADWAIETVRANRMERSVNAAEIGPDGLFVASVSGTLQQLLYDGDRDRWKVVASGPMGMASDGDLAFGDDGTLYAAVGGGKIATVNYDALSEDFGQAMVLFDTSARALFGLAFSEGELFGFTNPAGNYGRSSLVRIDLGTGALTEVASLDVAVWGAAAGPGNAVVPEPGAMALLAVGGLACLARRRR